jgi:hypothetical protein
MAKIARKSINNDRAVRRFAEEVRAIRGRNIAGLAEAAALIKQESQKKTPVDHGNLKASHYIATGGTVEEPQAQVYLTADYAVYVHENMESYHPIGEAKFLQNAVLENRADILEIIRSHLKV